MSKGSLRRNFLVNLSLYLLSVYFLSINTFITQECDLCVFSLWICRTWRHFCSLFLCRTCCDPSCKTANDKTLQHCSKCKLDRYFKPNSSNNSSGSNRSQVNFSGDNKPLETSTPLPSSTSASPQKKTVPAKKKNLPKKSSPSEGGKVSVESDPSPVFLLKRNKESPPILAESPSGIGTSYLYKALKYKVFIFQFGHEWQILMRVF